MTAPEFTGLSAGDLDRLRERLAIIGFTADGVEARLGRVAHQALDRNETTPAERVTRGGDALDIVIRLWLLQRPVDRDDLDRALPGLVDELAAGGLVTQSGGGARAAVDVRPYGDDHHDWWVIADLTPGLDGARPAVTADHVLGVNSAATTLAELTVPRDVHTALDLGSGCGLQSLHLSTQAGAVMATDISPRACTMTHQTARLNDVEVEVLRGDLFEPVGARRFDLIVSNPPFVVSPGTDVLTYRDSGLAGDEICRRLVRRVPAQLTDGGVCQTLANWVHRRGEDWRDRVGSWLEATDSNPANGDGHGSEAAACDAWVLEREVVDPAAYVEVWLTDAGLRGTPEYTTRYDAWLRWFDEQHIEGIGFGWIFLRRLASSAPTPRRRLEAWPHPVEQPLGAAIGRWLDRTNWLRDRDDESLRESRLRAVAPIDQEHVGRPGASDPEQILLRQRSGLRRAARLDTAEAGFVGACDGSLSVGQIVQALASLLDEDAAALASRLLPRVREWVDEGYLEPAPA